MPLANETVTAVLAEIEATGLEQVLNEIRSANLAAQITPFVIGLDGVAVMSVTNWETAQTVLAAPVPREAMTQLMEQVTARIAAQDATDLGPLLLQLHSAVRSYVGL